MFESTEKSVTIRCSINVLSLKLLFLKIKILFEKILVKKITWGPEQQEEIQRVIAGLHFVLKVMLDTCRDLFRSDRTIFTSQIKMYIKKTVEQRSPVISNS